MDLNSIRYDYTKLTLREEDAGFDPFALFATWFQDAVNGGQAANAMTLATVDPSGRPWARVVLLKEFDERGYVFYTNYESRKARHLAENPWAALTFFWAEFERQVHIRGTVTKVTEAESDAYFRVRPVASQIGAHASKQSSVLASRDDLERRVSELEREFEGREVPRPSNWGGYRVAPHAIEFWQGRPSRLHDRLLYTRDASGTWTRERLSP
jgi:pyridoxamine 5'-phosphate oxidase